jgi:hypothetical protein
MHGIIFKRDELYGLKYQVTFFVNIILVLVFEENCEVVSGLF